MTRRFQWFPPNPVWVAEYFVGGTCFSAICVSAAALWGIDLEQT